ncbi:hypothetical protein BDD12DRAFT_721066, partial [Trichophaea hybrida]
RYPRYSYKRDEPFWQQFRELCICYQWPTTRKDREADKDPNSLQKRAWKAFRIAVVQSFSTTFGTEVDDINAWRKMCMTVRVPGMRNLDGCRKAVLNPHFNLLDLHECGRMGQQVQIFEDKQDLLEYTQDTGRYYPLVPAKADPLLTYLLREI